MTRIDVLAFGAHPDDVEIHCGGFLLKMKRFGYRIGVVDLTKGELGTRGSVEIRRTESELASKILGLDIRENLGMPDGYLDICEAHKRPIVRMIRKYRPTIVLTHYIEDRHTDHTKAGQLVSEAAFLSGVQKYEPSEFSPHRPQRVIYYRSHYPSFAPSFVTDISDEFKRKMEVIKAFRSQFDPDYSADLTYISSPRFMSNLIAETRYWGARIGTKYGEPFFVREISRIDDPIKTWKII
ncbi:MAG: bacillithiol biosynthesis deacetylase BshB1 [Candidatus Cloacimonetes bacterium 4572_55]|nr:MAG: bacillithiol biosynthesis deacetylase BshB1 [Candidatus Cloacimonetes bacterium 4572_55]